MKFKSLFVSIISVATVSSLVEIHPASAGRTSTPVYRCTGSSCPVRGISTYGSGTLPVELLQQVTDLTSQGNFADANEALTQFLKKAEGAQDLDGQAAAHQALADIDARIGELDSASSHLRNAETLYQRSENSQGFSEVQLQQSQLQQLQIQQLQLQQLQLQRR
jgi:hypothetical protein